jgi:hypothetical protein
LIGNRLHGGELFNSLNLKRTIPFGFTSKTYDFFILSCQAHVRFLTIGIAAGNFRISSISYVLSEMKKDLEDSLSL